MGDIVSAARSLLRIAIAVVAIAGQAPHLTAVTNAQAALADARVRTRERREAAAAFQTMAAENRPLSSDSAPHTVAAGRLSPGS